MRATSSGMGYCIRWAIRLPLEIKELAELLDEKTGSNSLTLKKLLGGISTKPPTPKICGADGPEIYYVAAIAHAPYSETTIQRV
jgi:hypothetical protein